MNRSPPATSQRADWRDFPVGGPDYVSQNMSALPRNVSSLDLNNDSLDPATVDIAAARVAARLQGAASGSTDEELQFNMDGAGKKRTKKRAVRRKRTYKKSKRSYKKSKQSYKKSKRGGATAPMITFTIVKGNSDVPLLEVQLEPNQTGKDLYERVTEWLDQHPDMLTDAEKVGQRKLVTDNDVIVEYAKNLREFQPRTKLILSIIPEGSSRPHGRGRGQAPAAGA